MMEYTQEQMVKSLGFYVNYKMTKGAPKTSCWGNYLLTLKAIEAEAKGVAPFAGFTPLRPLVPLAQINVPAAWYARVVDLIYGEGDSFTDLTVEKVSGKPATPPVPPPPVPYFGKYVNCLGGDVRTEHDVEAVMRRTNELLAASKTNRINGLVVGRVQSGKTRNYVGLMLKAMDEGWNVCIVLTCANTLLAEQTQSRIERDFGKVGVSGSMLDFHGKAAYLPSPDALADKTSTAFFWGVAMKQVNNLDSLLNWLGKGSAYAENMRVLVIDDEADNATPDANTRSDDFLSDEDIDDLVANIRDEEELGANAAFLSAWVEGLPTAMAAKFAEAARLPEGKTAAAIKGVTDILDGAVSLSTRRNQILADKTCCALLGLTDFVSAEGWEPLDLTETASLYFNKTTAGRSCRTCGKFVKFLRTVFDIEQERSAISARVCKLIDRAQSAKEPTFNFGKCAYVAYTATPYANILNETVDETPLYADFMFSLECSPRYFGLAQIFGADYTSPEPRMPIVEFIPEPEVRFVLRPLQGVEDERAVPAQKYIVNVQPLLAYQTTTRLNESEDEGEWTSLKRALVWAFCSAGARAWRRKRRGLPEKGEREERWTTMLMNISQKCDAHEAQKNLIETYFKAQFETAERKAAFLDFCREAWTEQTAKFPKDTFDALFNDPSKAPGDRYGEIDDYPTWAQVEGEVRGFIDGAGMRVHVIVINSHDSDARDRYNQTGAHVDECAGDHLWIVCGGNTISRGLTLLGLTISYFDRVRSTVAVDTLTQMGRWFGYRAGYELLPRIWMTTEAIEELKRTTVVEDTLHEEIREMFDAGISPSQEPENYAKIYFWGRRLSGRARAQRLLLQGVGTMGGTSGDLYADAAHMGAVAARMRAFLKDLGEQTSRSKDYRYAQFPFWTKVDKAKIMAYVLEQAKDSPERTRKVLNGLAREIEHTVAKDPNDLLWDVVVGEPSTNKAKKYEIGVGREIWSSSPSRTTIKGGCAIYSSVRSDMAFFAAIKKADFVRIEAKMLQDRLDDILLAIDEAATKNGGEMPKTWTAALEAFPGATIRERVTAFLEKACEEPQSVALTEEGELPPCFRSCLPIGYRNRSSTDYRERVYEAVGLRRPVLQIYLLTPPEGSEETQEPMVIHAFYWPDHAPDAFAFVSVGLPAPERKGPPLGKFAQTVEDVLRENDFPMRSGGKVSEGGGLREKVVSLLAADGCDEAFYNANIAKNLWGAPYKAMPAPHSDCYYHVGWAEDPIAKIRGLILQWALEVLADHQVHEERLLAQAVVAAHPLLIGVYPIVQGQDVVMVTDGWREIFTDEVLAENGIEKVSGNPISYRLKFEKEEAGWW